LASEIQFVVRQKLMGRLMPASSRSSFGMLTLPELAKIGLRWA